MMDQRSNTSTRLRKYSGATIFDCAATDLSTSDNRYETFRRKIGWEPQQNGSFIYETWNVEILHKDYQGEFDINRVFLNPALLRVSKYAMW